jgi:DNA (cytosine-5)-methyltransferase 1
MEEITSRLDVAMDAPAFERHLSHLRRDFHIEVRPGRSCHAYKLGAFRAFLGQEDHVRHEAFAKPGKIS